MRQAAVEFSLCIALCAGSAAADTVDRREGRPPVTGRITGVDENGVTVKSERGATHFIPWDRVRNVDQNAGDPNMASRLAQATDLWRARSRVERRDTALAEPLFVRFAEEYAGRTHETALVVAEGLLRCRLDRGAHAAAVVPALEVLRLRRAGVATDSYAMLAPALDETFQLSPHLAPVWIDDAAVARLEHELGAYDAHGDEVVAAMARLYRIQARRHLELEPPEDEDAPTPDHPGVKLLDMIVSCAATDADTRSSARERLERSIADGPEWAEAWARFFIGRSLLAETGVGRQERGLVQLSHLPARFDRRQPFLAGVAIGVLADGLEAQGEYSAAAALRAEAIRRLPHHPLYRTPSREQRSNDRTRS